MTSESKELGSYPLKASELSNSLKAQEINKTDKKTGVVVEFQRRPSAEAVSVHDLQPQREKLEYIRQLNSTISNFNLKDQDNSASMLPPTEIELQRILTDLSKALISQPQNSKTDPREVHKLDLARVSDLLKE